MNLAELPKRITGFTELGETDVLRIIIWWAHTYENKDTVDSAYLRSCYTKLCRAIPNGGLVAYLNPLVKRKPPHLIKSRDTYKLEHRVATELSSKYGQRDATVHVEKLLANLPQKIPNLSEQEYLKETITCLKNGAFRATVVMAWNLAYDHLCGWILADGTRLLDFNTQAPKSYPKAALPLVVKREDFQDYKESQVLLVAKSSRVITDNLYKILKEKLDRRNVAAHPSSVKTLQPTAEEVIRDLVENVVLQLN